MEWISVKKELPSFMEKVLAFSEGANRIYICFRREENEYNEHWVICEDQDCSCTGATGPIDYWMPCPNQPERSKREDGIHSLRCGNCEKVYDIFLDPNHGYRCGALNSMET